MRILHTSDWHLGHTLHGWSRGYEHTRFLDWLTGTLVRERIDVLLVCGDVFETANPGADALRSYYRFLADVHRESPHLQVVVIAGNHDSAQRLQAPQDILQTMNVHVVGDSRGADGELQLDRLVVPLRDARGRVQAICAAVPFLRPADLGSLAELARSPASEPEGTEPADPLIEGVRRLYGEVLDAARARRQPGQALVAMGHCFMVGTEVSTLSERKILGGNLHALPFDLFPDDVDYVALGHLHKPQRVGGREHVRYCGSPIPLSMAEARNRHQVCLVEIAAGRTGPVKSLSEKSLPEKSLSVRSLPVPRSVDLVRIPRSGAVPIGAVLERIDRLPTLEEFGDAIARPFLEVNVLLEEPLPDVRALVEDRLEGRAPRLVRLGIEYPAGRRALAEVAAQPVLQDLSPEQVFRSLYATRHEGEVPDPLLAAFHELVDQVRQWGGAG